mmetsp:Transcript_20884/g.42630  ORF Transcript_20884/g.42630 Transcript_20884/m.42630 type:complete len:389 (-) Transcript_20884:1029-2195(-)
MREQDLLYWSVVVRLGLCSGSEVIPSPLLPCPHNVSCTCQRGKDAECIQREMKPTAFLISREHVRVVTPSRRPCICQNSDSGTRTTTSWARPPLNRMTAPTKVRKRGRLSSTNTLFSTPSHPLRRFESRGMEMKWPFAFTSHSLPRHDRMCSVMGILRGKDMCSRMSRSNQTSGKDEASGTSGHKKSGKMGIAAALFATYFSVMFAKCALPSTLSLLTAPDSGLTSSPLIGSSVDNSLGGIQASMARVLTLSTIFLSFGKLILGPVIDSVTGIPCLKAALFTLACCLCAIARATSFGTFAVAWVLIDFVFSSCWAACLNSVHGIFDEEEWPEIISMLAVAARTGNAVAFATFGTVLDFASDRGNGFRYVADRHSKEPWRLVFWGELYI